MAAASYLARDFTCLAGGKVHLHWGGGSTCWTRVRQRAARSACHALDERKFARLHGSRAVDGLQVGFTSCIIILHIVKVVGDAPLKMP